MFEKIILRRAENGAGISAGDLAEALFYYQNVHLVLDYGCMIGLIQKIGMPTFLSLLSRPTVSAIYTEDMLTVFPETINSKQYYSFEAFHIVGNESAGTLHTPKKRFEFLLTDKCGYSRKHAKNYQERFRKLAPFRKLNSDHYVEGGLLNAATLDLLDASYVQEAIKLSLENHVGKGNFPSNFSFNIFPENNRFQIDTNLNFSELTKHHKVKWGGSGDLRPANLLLDILNAKNELIFASHFGGEMYTSSLTSKLIDLKCAGLLKRANIDQVNIDNFTKSINQEAPRIKDCIDSGERSFDDFLQLLDKSEKFKSWLVDRNPDVDLVAEYIQAITSEGWIQSIPSKSIRYILSGIAGVIEPISGNLVSLADSFLIEKIFGGWKPNRFVNNELIPFLDSE